MPILKDLLKISRLSNIDTTTLDKNECIQTEANSSSEASSNLESLTDSFLEKIDPLDYKYIKEILKFLNHT